QHCKSRGVSRDQSAGPTQAGAPGRPPKSTGEQAVELYRQGATIEDVVRQTNRARSTAVEYLCNYLRAEPPTSVSRWISDDIYRTVSDVAARVGTGRLKPIFDALEGKYTYDDIRIVVTHLNACGGDFQA